MTDGPGLDDGGASRTPQTVFVSDPTAEAERIAQALRAAGYAVVDVPLSMLVARVAVQHPRVILVDADAEGALEVVARMRELPAADAIDVLFIARAGGAVATPEQALAHEGSGLFVRPVDVPSIVRKVEALTDGALHDGRGASSAPPPASAPGSRKRSSIPPSLSPASVRSGASPASSPDSRTAGLSLLPAMSTRSSRAPSEPPASAGAGAVAARRLLGLASPVSLELQQLLADAEQRAHVGSDAEGFVPSPEEEIEAVLPAEFLASLDEPLEADDEEDDLAPQRSVPMPREPTHDGGGPRTTGGRTTGAGSMPGPTPPAAGDIRSTGEVDLTPPPPATHGGTHAGGTGTGSSTSDGSLPRPVLEASPPPAPVEPVAVSAQSIAPPTHWSPPDLGLSRPPSVRPSDDRRAPSVLGPGDALLAVARAIAARTSAALRLLAPDGERWIVLREGDVVTTSSSFPDESLLAFLGVRGDLPRETVRRLEGKFPAAGRHASAALVARGFLRQDQMWPTLRAHAEWLLGRALQMPSGQLAVEPDAPARLAAEPGVFGGAPGASVFVEVVRRTVAPVEAIDRLGGPSSRVSEGPEARLLGECALGAADLEVLRSSSGRSLREVLEGAGESDLATVVFALAQLGVLEVLRGVGAQGAGADDGRASEADVAAIDADAIRERVRARLQLVEDGDYFAILGVPRRATGYEVRRAFLELRRGFDPSRVLTPEVADLADDVRKITMVLEEAYDILKDSARRERYKRAIEAQPEG